MFPLRDNVPSRTIPFVNLLLILATSAAFFAQLRQLPDDPSLVERYGMIPARVVEPEKTVYVTEEKLVRSLFGTRLREVKRPAAPAGVPAWLTVLTCIFLHGGWLHFLGNMWFLWIFGDNVEDRLGHVGYLLFYIAAGALASMAHLYFNAGSPIPTIGASGAIAGVMGAYLVLYPRAQVLAVVPIFFFLQILVLPAPIFLGVWFLMQFYQGTLAVGSTASSGVAWWAHIGGFAAGAAVAALLWMLRLTRPPVESTRGRTQRIGGERVLRRWNE